MEERASHTYTGERDTHLILDIRDLVKVREQGGVVFELKVPLFRVRRGQFCGIVGESGCGKSTLLDMLALVLRPTYCVGFDLIVPHAGDSIRAIDVNTLWERDDEAALAKIRRNYLGYVLQSGGLLPFLTVYENIRLPLRLKKGAQKNVVIEKLALRMGVNGLFGKKPHYLSGGQRQRIAIMRAMVHQPMIILADEPTAAVDSERAKAIIDDFHMLAKEYGTSIVVVTHNHRLIESVADRLYTYELSEISQTVTRSVCAPMNG
jgi:putative ABC transport system ATP-binding protein